MRKRSFLSLSVVLLLLLSACTKEDNLPYYPPVDTGNNNANPYSVSYSYWTPDANLSWSDGGTTEPSHQAELAVPELTQEVIDAGGFVLLYARLNGDTIVQIIPTTFTNINGDETNSYAASFGAGAVTLSHTRLVNGVAEVPNDSNEINFRYIVISPNTPDPNGRPITIDEFRNIPYRDLVNLLGIPE